MEGILGSPLGRTATDPDETVALIVISQLARLSGESVIIVLPDQFNVGHTQDSLSSRYGITAEELVDPPR